jgi:hypothetical protein
MNVFFVNSSMLICGQFSQRRKAKGDKRVEPFDSEGGNQNKEQNKKQAEKRKSNKPN